jgi:hypothetical protein
LDARAIANPNPLLYLSSCRTERRTGGSSSGTSDTYYYNPEGVKFRSRQEVLRKFGL